MKHAAWIVLLGVLSCGREITEAPLDQADRGIAALRWGDGGDTVAARMMEMDGVHLVTDTVMTWYFASWHSPDSVNLPSHLRHFRWMNFRGGRWFGFPVAWWGVTIDQETSLREIEIVLEPIENSKPVVRSIRRQMLRLYGEPARTEGSYDRFDADGWTERAADPSRAAWAVGLRQSMKLIEFKFTDRRWADSLALFAQANPRRRIHVSEWEEIKRQIKDEKGWDVE